MLERLGHRLAGTVLFWDLILTFLSLELSSRFRIGVEFGKNIDLERVTLPFYLYAAVGIIWMVVFLLFAPQRAIFTCGLVQAIGRLISAIALGSLAFAGLLYLTLREVSRLQFLYFVLINLFAILLFHLLVRAYIRLRMHDGKQRKVLLVGGGETARQLIQEIARRPWSGIKIVGVTSDEPPDTSLQWLGTIDQTVDIVVRDSIDEVVFALPSDQHERIARMTLQLQQYPVMVHMVPGVLDLAFARTSVQALGGIPLISLRESVLSENQRMLKRIFDIIASTMMLILLSPVMITIALLIKLGSEGPIFFLQERIGENGKRFKMIKFRSMYQDAELRWKEVAQRDAEGHIIHKHAQDPRITPIGAKLRRLSLDELPQLFNVVRGEMSLVGPRPEMPYIAVEYEPWQWQRFRVPPGMTGWWQINGRSSKPMHLHTEEDLYYIQNYSFWLDLMILIKTIRVVINGRGAY